MLKMLLSFLLLSTAYAATTRRLSVDFLASVEGFFTDAYCLDPVKYPKSGVTIGIGVDFGSKNAAQLRAASVSESIIKLVTPYFGLKGQAACNKVSTYKVRLTKDAAMALSDAIIQQESGEAAARYNSARPSTSLPFDSLTCAQRTVVASVLYQYGLPSKVPRFWSYVIANNWNQVIYELRHFNDQYPTRRNKEADLVQYSSTSKTCPTANSDICKMTKGSCKAKTQCTAPKITIHNFCQLQMASVVCCV